MSTDSYVHLARPGDPGGPLVFAFHGTGGSEAQFADFIAGTLPDAALVAPRGDVSEMGAARFFRRTGEGVYDMDDLSARREKMAGFIAAHRARHVGGPVIGLGYSNGANILAAVAFEHPGLFDALVLMHPLIPWTPAPQLGLKGRQVLITAGRADPICSWPRTETLTDWFRAQGANVTLADHPGGHEVTQDELKAVQDGLRTFAQPEGAGT